MLMLLYGQVWQVTNYLHKYVPVQTMKEYKWGTQHHKLTSELAGDK